MVAALFAGWGLSPAPVGAAVRPDHVVVVVMQDRFSDAIGNPVLPYVNALAEQSLVYTNSHGVTHPSTPNGLALYSGSTQGITDNGRNHSFSSPNLARSLFDAGYSFAGYVESLPADGSQVTQAGTAQFPDLYTRNINPMAQFTNVGVDPITGLPRPNSAVNKTFASFTAIPQNDYSSLPTVSFVIPSNRHNTHGSNETWPWAGSPDEEDNDILRGWADDWLEANIDPYRQWAEENNSLLIITQDEERWTGGTAETITTMITGDPDLFVAGENDDYINHYLLLATILNWYDLDPIGQMSPNPSGLYMNAAGQVAPSAIPEPGALSLVCVISAGLLARRRG